MLVPKQSHFSLDVIIMLKVAKNIHDDKKICILDTYSGYSLRNPSKGCQGFVDAVILILASDWSEGLSIFENVIDMPFRLNLQTSNSAKFCQIG